MSGETILVVDDEIFIRDLLKKYLGRDGYNVLPTADATEALEAFARASPPVDLVVTNMGMPGMNGLAMARQIRATAPNMPIVFYTGAAHLKRADVTALGGRAAFLCKPGQLAEMRVIIRELLDQPVK